MLELKYVIPEDEIGTVTIRAYFRGKTVFRDRLRNSLWGGFWGAFGVMIVVVGGSGWPVWWIWPIAMGVAMLLTYLSFQDSTASRIERHIRAQRNSTGPIDVTFRIGEGKIHAVSEEVEKIFRIQDISWVGRDQDYLEVRLDEKGHIAIPLRAFEDEAHLERFIQALGIAELSQLRDLSKDKSLMRLPKKQPTQGAIPRAYVIWYVIAFASTALGIAALALTLKMAGGPEAFTSPLGLMALAMALFGILTAVVLLLLRSRK